MPTARAQRAREIGRDLTIVGFLESEIEFSRHDDIRKMAGRVKVVRSKLGKVQMKETAWMDKGKFEIVRAEMDAAPVIEADGIAAMENVELHLVALETRYL